MSNSNHGENYRGKYATENEAMLDQEQLRLTAWQAESTVYRTTRMPILVLLAVLAIAAGGTVAVFLSAGGQP